MDLIFGSGDTAPAPQIQTKAKSKPKQSQKHSKKEGKEEKTEQKEEHNVSQEPEKKEKTDANTNVQHEKKKQDENLPEKTVRSSIVILAPNSPEIDRIRRVHDKSFYRWMPHINL